jgi:hypothetical protein
LSKELTTGKIREMAKDPKTRSPVPLVIGSFSLGDQRSTADPFGRISARHKAQRLVLTENAFAIIDRKGRWCGKARN